MRLPLWNSVPKCVTEGLIVFMIFLVSQRITPKERLDEPRNSHSKRHAIHKLPVDDRQQIVRFTGGKYHIVQYQVIMHNDNWDFFDMGSAYLPTLGYSDATMPPDIKR
ncbi:hypothetical protein N7466_009536 [Penicillium verhagenii]|uniref:uncharacterized protein n=1 Tax=Penicillium verhagenii TaxID=1562060 RepID=UPI0025455FBD|nr:uncharacterized protein N7466_009536 [Penicillium verhagenii]KAJ5921210.1 hypothetical protein N7466_009536 [Penicillium verhagenii]